MAKRVVILGGGESGTGAAVLAKRQNFDLFVSDYGKIADKYKALLTEHQIDFEELRHSEDLILNADTVIKSPGIPDNAPIVEKIRTKGIELISEIEFASFFTEAKMICITGSNGKTTTSMLLYQIFKDAGLNVGLAGNVGRSLAMQVALEKYDYYVLELSSFQLDDMIAFKADVAILLNISPDHLDRYDNDFQKYIDSKFRIIQNQTKDDYFIYWEEDVEIDKRIKKIQIASQLLPFAENRSESSQAYIENDELIITNKEIFNMATTEIAIKGKHNRHNAMAAGLAASIMDIRKDNIRQSLRGFQGVEHRLEYVATVRDVVYVNDSKATNVNSCWYALDSINSSVVLIMGGTDKGNDYSEIEALVVEKVNHLILLGLDNSKLKEFFEGKVEHISETKSMEESVKLAYEVAKPGDTVLLSPSCASFDLFKNYEDRGKQFKDYVRKL